MGTFRTVSLGSSVNRGRSVRVRSREARIGGDVASGTITGSGRGTRRHRVGGGSVALMECSHRIRRGDHLARTVVDRHPRWTTKITHARCIQHGFRRAPKPALPRSNAPGTPQRKHASCGYYEEVRMIPDELMSATNAYRCWTGALRPPEPLHHGRASLSPPLQNENHQEPYSCYREHNCGREGAP